MSQSPKANTKSMGRAADAANDRRETMFQASKNDRSNRRPLDDRQLDELNRQCINIDRPAAAGGGAAAAVYAPAAAAVVAELNEVPLPANEQLTRFQRIIAAANRRRDEAERQGEVALQYQNEMGQMVQFLQTLNPAEPGFRAQAGQAARRGIAPILRVLRDAIQTSTTGPLRDMSRDQINNVLRSSRANAIQLGDDDETPRFIECYENLLLEAINKNINLTNAALTAAFNLIWGDNLIRIGASMLGTYFSIIIAADSLILFGNTIIGAITFGRINLEYLTVLCGHVYHNCTWINFGNFLVTMGVTADNALLYIDAIQNYTVSQLHYIIMTIYIFGLEQFSGNIQIGHERLNQLFNAMQINPPANVDLGAIPNAAQLVGAVGLPAVVVPQGGPANLPMGPAGTLLNIYGNIVVIGKKLRDILITLYNSGMRFCGSCVLKLLTLFAVAVNPNTSFRNVIIQRFSDFSNFISEIVVQRANILDDRPNRRLISLILKLIGLDLRAPNLDFSFTMTRFSMKTLSQMRVILQNHILGIQQETNIIDAECLTFLARFFDTTNGAGGPLSGLDIARFQNVSMVVPLFRSQLTEEAVGTVTREENIDDTNRAVVGRNESIEPVRYEVNDIVEGYTGYEEEICMVYNGATQVAAVMLHIDNPAADPQTIYRREAFKAMIFANSANMEDKFCSHMRSLVNKYYTSEECNRLIAHCSPRVKELEDAIMSEENTGLIDYLIDTSPNTTPPVTLIEACNGVRDTIWEGITGRTIQGLKEATTDALASWGASISGFSVCAAHTVGAAAAAATAAAKANCKRLFSFLLPAPALNLDVIPPAAAAVNADRLIENVADLVRQDAVRQANRPIDAENADANAVAAADVIANNLFQGIDALESPAAQAVHVDNMGLDGGRSRSRKRSASKRTRRRKVVAKKQKSKKNKRQSRRKVRRYSSRKAGRK